jgi:predicted nucleic acid-binding protein
MANRLVYDTNAVIRITTEVEMETIKIRRANPRIKLPDAVVAATTVSLQAMLISGDISPEEIRAERLSKYLK